MLRRSGVAPPGIPGGDSRSRERRARRRLDHRAGRRTPRRARHGRPHEPRSLPREIHLAGCTDSGRTSGRAVGRSPAARAGEPAPEIDSAEGTLLMKVSLAAALLVIPLLGNAQSVAGFPSKPVRMIVPF